MSRDVKKLSWKEFIAQYDSKVVDAIAKNRMKPGVTGIVTLQCEVLDSSRCGMKTALIYGPECTYKSVDQMLENKGGVYVTGLPSSASFPVNYTEDMPL
jgi:hypothetical protein